MRDNVYRLEFRETTEEILQAYAAEIEACGGAVLGHSVFDSRGYMRVRVSDGGSLHSAESQRFWSQMRTTVAWGYLDYDTGDTEPETMLICKNPHCTHYHRPFSSLDTTYCANIDGYLCPGCGGTDVYEYESDVEACL